MKGRRVEDSVNDFVIVEELISDTSVTSIDSNATAPGNTFVTNTYDTITRWIVNNENNNIIHIHPGAPTSTTSTTASGSRYFQALRDKLRSSSHHTGTFIPFQIVFISLLCWVSVHSYLIVGSVDLSSVDAQSGKKSSQASLGVRSMGSSAVTTTPGATPTGRRCQRRVCTQ